MTSCDPTSPKRGLCRFPGAKQVEQLVDARGGAEPVAKAALRKHLRELGEELKMLFGRVLGDEQHEQLPDRLAVGRVESNGPCQSNECTGRLAESFDAAVRNRNALTQARGAELLACGEACRNDRASEPRAPLEQRAGLLEEAGARNGVALHGAVP